MLKAIVFDFDGVLVDSEPLHYRAFLKVLEPVGVRFNYETYLKRYLGFDDRDGFRQMLLDHDAEGRAEVAALCDAKQGAFNAVVTEGVEAIPGALELLREAAGEVPDASPPRAAAQRRRGGGGALKVAIASGATREDIDHILDALGQLAKFETIVTADDVARSKPDPQTYALAVERLGLEPHECLAIEDTAAGIASAKGAGLRTLGITTTGPAARLAAAERVHDANGLEGVTLSQLQSWFGSW